MCPFLTLCLNWTTYWYASTPLDPWPSSALWPLPGPKTMPSPISRPTSRLSGSACTQPCPHCGRFPSWPVVPWSASERPARRRSWNRAAESRWPSSLTPASAPSGSSRPGEATLSAAWGPWLARRWNSSARSWFLSDLPLLSLVPIGLQKWSKASYKS